MPDNAIRDVLAEASRYVGVVEVPRSSNRGITIDYWNWEAIRDWREFPLGGRGAPWCAAFVSQVGVQALGRSRWPMEQTAIAHRMFEWAEMRNLAMATPHTGDIFCIWYESRQKYGHVGFVINSTGDRYTTLEGNTGPGGSREGYGVFQRERTVKPGDAFIRWTGAM